MIPIKPIIHPIEPFDSSLGTTINFTWNGNRFFKSRCIIKEKTSGTIIYNEITETMRPEYHLPPESGLVNGTCYTCYITVFDINDLESDTSDAVLFYCYSSPTFQLSIQPNDVIRTSVYESALHYSQAENELLQSYTITLYSYQKVALQTSGTMYPPQDFTSGELSYIISSLENANQYYIKATGTTIQGMHLETPDILFTVAYENLQPFAVLETNNHPDIGAVELRSNLISTEGIPDKDVVFIDGKYADLRDNSVQFDIGYQIAGDFSHVFKFYEPVLNQQLLLIKDADDKMQISCSYREGIFDDSNGKKGVIELTANSSGVNYTLYSNYFNIPTDSECISYCITRKGPYFDTKAVIIPK